MPLQSYLFRCHIFSQMDISAVAHASDDFLLQLGFEQAGDRLSLKAFCARECETNDKSGEGKNSKKRKGPY